MELISSIADRMSDAPTIPEIVKRAGGAVTIEAESLGELTAGAVYKWTKIGIPDRHWPLIMRLSRATADELLAANIAARTPAGAAA